MYKRSIQIFPMLILITAMAVWIGNGKKSRNDLLKDSISKYKDTIEPFEIITYHPEEYTEIVKDSILSNGFKVKIKTFTNMDKAIENISNTNSTIRKNYFRTIDSNVIVFKNDKLIFSETINTVFVSKLSGNQKLTHKYIGGDVYIDEEASLNSNQLVLIASLYSPNNNTYISYNIIIDENGSYTLNKLNHART